MPPGAVPADFRRSFRPGPVGAHLEAAYLGAVCPGLRQEPAPPEGLWPDGLTGVDTVDTHSRGRSDCRPAFSLCSLMFSGFSSLPSSTDCLTS